MVVIRIFIYLSQMIFSGNSDAW